MGGERFKKCGSKRGPIVGALIVVVILDSCGWGKREDLSKAHFLKMILLWLLKVIANTHLYTITHIHVLLFLQHMHTHTHRHMRPHTHLQCPDPLHPPVRWSQAAVWPAYHWPVAVVRHAGKRGGALWVQRGCKHTHSNHARGRGRCILLKEALSSLSLFKMFTFSFQHLTFHLFNLSITYWFYMWSCVALAMPGCGFN